MFGIVWTYNEMTEEGTIIASDKHLYRFSKADYNDPSRPEECTPEECTMVGFRADGDFAKEMTPVALAA